MNINGANITIFEEDKKWLKLFFQNNNDFMNNNSLIEYENIKKFADLYELFLEEHDLKDNDILMLFLTELRYEQLSYKIITNSNKIKLERLAISNIKLSDSIKKWYDEVNKEKDTSTLEALEWEKFNRSVKSKAMQNRAARARGIESARNFIVGGRGPY